MGFLGIVFVYIICLQIFKWNSNMVHSIGGVPQGVFKGQFTSLQECAIFIFKNMFHR
jgi:hypothetical protein